MSWSGETEEHDDAVEEEEEESGEALTSDRFVFVTASSPLPAFASDEATSEWAAMTIDVGRRQHRQRITGEASVRVTNDAVAGWEVPYALDRRCGGKKDGAEEAEEEIPSKAGEWDVGSAVCMVWSRSFLAMGFVFSLSSSSCSSSSSSPFHNVDPRERIPRR